MATGSKLSRLLVDSDHGVATDSSVPKLSVFFFAKKPYKNSDLFQSHLIVWGAPYDYCRPISVATDQGVATISRLPTDIGLFCII